MSSSDESSTDCSESVLVDALCSATASPQLLNEHALLVLRRPLRGPGVVPAKIPLVCTMENDPAIVLGRGNKANVFIYAAEHPSFVSRDHAEFSFQNSSWQVTDLASVNGVYVHLRASNRVIKVSREGCNLEQGDRVFFGNPQHSFFVEYEFCNDAENDDVKGTGVEHTKMTVEEDLPGDVWMFRIFPFLDIETLVNCQLCSTTWRARVDVTISHLRTVKWKYEWGVEMLPAFLKHRVTRPTQLALQTPGCLRMRDVVLDSITDMLASRLVSLDLSGTPAMSALSMETLVRNCPLVTKLLLRGCKRIGMPTWNWISKLPELIHLDLCCTGCSDLTIRLLNSPKLRSIELGFMAGNHMHQSITNASLQLLATKCKLLESIDLRGCKRLTDSGIRWYCQQQSHTLTSLVLHSCDVGDETLAVIGAMCSELQTLDIHRCVRVTNSGLQSLRLNKLQRLDLSNLNISDAGLVGLAGNCTQLVELDLRTCRNVTGKGVLALVEACAKTLCCLDINGCNQVLPNQVLQIAHLLCPRRLKSLEIGGKDDDSVTRHAWTKEDVDICRVVFGSDCMHATFDALLQIV